jgi:RNA polymerase sigma-70 factor, ECF subfamily
VSIMTNVRRHQNARAAHNEHIAEEALPSTISDQAMAQLVDQHGAALRRFLRRLTHGDRERAEDIYQETLLRAWQHPECCERGLELSRTWLYTVARRISIDEFRASASRPALVSDQRKLDVAPDPVDCIDRMLLAADVQAALATLSAVHQEVLREMYFQDRPAAQIAERLGVPEGTVRSRAYYALRALKDALVERGLEHPLAKTA